MESITDRLARLQTKPKKRRLGTMRRRRSRFVSQDVLDPGALVGSSGSSARRRRRSTAVRRRRRGASPAPIPSPPEYGFKELSKIEQILTSMADKMDGVSQNSGKVLTKVDAVSTQMVNLNNKVADLAEEVEEKRSTTITTTTLDFRRRRERRRRTPAPTPAPTLAPTTRRRRASSLLHRRRDFRRRILPQPSPTPSPPDFRRRTLPRPSPTPSPTPSPPDF